MKQSTFFIMASSWFIMLAALAGAALGWLASLLYSLLFTRYNGNSALITHLASYGAKAGGITALGAALLLVLQLYRRHQSDKQPAWTYTVSFAILYGILSSMGTHLFLAMLSSPSIASNNMDETVYIAGPFFGVLAGLIFGSIYHAIAKASYYHLQNSNSSEISK